MLGSHITRAPARGQASGCPRYANYVEATAAQTGTQATTWDETSVPQYVDRDTAEVLKGEYLRSCLCLTSLQGVHPVAVERYESGPKTGPLV
jgi:hypothetical protein